MMRRWLLPTPGPLKSSSDSSKLSCRSNTISRVLPRASTASGPRLASTPTKPAAAPAAAPIPTPSPVCPATLPAMAPTLVPAPAASPTVRASPPLLESPRMVPSSRSSFSVAWPSKPPMRARKSLVTPLGRVIESKRMNSSARAFHAARPLHFGDRPGHIAAHRYDDASVL